MIILEYNKQIKKVKKKKYLHMNVGHSDEEPSTS